MVTGYWILEDGCWMLGIEDCRLKTDYICHVTSQPMQSKNIGEVISQLEDIVARARAEGDPLGFFAQLYLGVTRGVRDGVLSGRFEDGPLMERLDVIFANRYLAAHRLFYEGKPATQSWQTAFLAAGQNKLLIIQHLLMGMNAHINLDLGIAAAEAAGADGLPSLEKDFFEINNLLFENIEQVQDRLGQLSPLLFLLDLVGKKSDEHFAAFSLKQARHHAWQVAKRISQCKNETEKQAQISEIDRYVAVLNKLITEPGPFVGGLARLVKLFETKEVPRVIARLGKG